MINGLTSVVPSEVKMFTWQEICQKLMGSPEIRISDLKKIFICGDFSESDDVIVWFWQVLEEFTAEGKALIGIF